MSLPTFQLAKGKRNYRILYPFYGRAFRLFTRTVQVFIIVSMLGSSIGAWAPVSIEAAPIQNGNTNTLGNSALLTSQNTQKPITANPPVDAQRSHSHNRREVGNFDELSYLTPFMQETEDEILFDFNDSPQGWEGLPGSSNCPAAQWSPSEGHWFAGECADPGEGLKGKITYSVPYHIETLELFLGAKNCSWSCGHHLTIWVGDVKAHDKSWAWPNIKHYFDLSTYAAPYQLTIFFYGGGGSVWLDDIKFTNVTYLPQVPSEATHSTGDLDACFGSTYNGTWSSPGGPINTRTGGVDYSVQDLSIPTTAGPLSLNRTYASPIIDLYSTSMGVGWTHNHEVRLVFPDDPDGKEGTVLFKVYTANRYEFLIIHEGEFQAYPGLCGELSRDEGPPVTYTVTDQGQRTYHFDEGGKLLTFFDSTGHSLHYTYDGVGLLTRVVDDTALRFLDFSYDDQDRLSAVSDHTGRQTSYTYDAAGDIISATDILNQTWTYTYQDHRLTEVIDPRGITVERTEYDEDGRALRQYNGKDELVVELIYNEDGATTVIDGLGNIETHTYDNRNTLTNQTDASGGQTKKVYDANFRPVWITDVNQNKTFLTWSEDGENLTQVEDALGNTTDLTYDDLSNLTQVIDPHGFTSAYAYNVTLLTEATDALGNTIRYTYTPEGYLASITDPLGNTSNYTYDSHGQRTSMTDALGNTTYYRYDDLGRLQETEDPLGRTTRITYDSAGRIIRTTRNYDPTRPQNGEEQYNIITEYLYDEVGNQIEVIDTFGRSIQYEYDAAGQLTKTTEPTGNFSINTYDEVGNLISTTDELGRVTTFTYDEINRPIATIDPLGHTSTTTYNPDCTVASFTDDLGRTTYYKYDNLMRSVEVTDPLGYQIFTSYDAAGNVVATTDANGNKTTYEYDALNRLVRQIDPLGGVTTYTYDAAGNQVQTTDPNSNTTAYEYNALNRLIAVIDALGNRTTNAYDALGNRLSMTDANGNTTTYSYNALNRLVTTTDPLGNTSHTSYKPLGNVFSNTDPNGNITIFEYDSLERLIKQIDALGGETSYAYDAVGNQLTVTNASGYTTTTVYDSLNRPISVTDPNGNSRTIEYDAVGSVITSTDALGNSTTFSYDDLNRRTSFTDPLGNTTTYAYDAMGNRISMTDALGVVTSYEYDALSRLTAVVENHRPGFLADPETNVHTGYTYDLVGNRLSIQDGREKVTTFTYDALNRLISETDPLGNITIFTYDPVGNRNALTDANGFITTYLYDATNILVTIDYPDPDADVTFAHDPAGNRTSMVDGVGTTTWAYDGLHRATAITDPFGDTVGYAYDPVSNRTGLTYPDGKVVSYEYDLGDRMARVTDWDGNITTYDYDAADQLQSTHLPNDITSDYSYDNAGRLLKIEHANETNILSSFEYIYDAVGNRMQAIEFMLLPGAEPEPPYKLYLPIVKNQTGEGGTGSAASNTSGSTPLGNPSISHTIDYTYDPLYRLTAADYSTGEFFHYGYDPVGNRLTQETLNATNIYAYEDTNRLVEVDGVAYSWDANGNLIDDGDRAYTYDHVNRLSFIIIGASTHSYAYNGLGDRVQQSTDGDATNYTLDLNRGLTQVLSDDSNAYLYGLGRIGELQTSGWQYHLPDALGSVRQLVDPVAAVSQSQSHEPFGDVISSAGQAASSYSFASEWMDATGLMYLRARYYSPQSGRFFVKDPWQGTPLQPATMNTYQYALNNPILNTDPTGSIVCLCGIDPETGFCHPCSNRYSFLPPFLAQVVQTMQGLLDIRGVLIMLGIIGCHYAGQLIEKKAPALPRIFYPDERLYEDPYAGPVIWERGEPEPEHVPIPLGPDIVPRVTETPRQNDVIYRRAGNTATERNVALYRGQDWLSGLSFATIPLTGAINIIYSVKKLEGTGFAVIYDGGKLDKYGIENPYWHVTVYYPIPTIWNEWYSWERTRENLGRPDNSLMDYHSMTYLLWNLRDGTIP